MFEAGITVGALMERIKYTEQLADRLTSFSSDSPSEAAASTMCSAVDMLREYANVMRGMKVQV